ncbi:MAG TPA: hypothetical protein VKT29_01895 [Terriglobales bacterium]|nr:hypothetical protein [Terriglobales bacterium]
MTPAIANYLDSIYDSLYAAIRELNLQMPKNRQIPPLPQTALFGDNSYLDSLGLANFIVLAEQKLEQNFGVTVDLTQDNPFSDESGHFRTLGTLALYTASLLKAKNRE